MKATLYYDCHIFCCTNRREPGHTRGCCAEKDSEKLRQYMKDKAKEMGLIKTRVNTAGCLDRCELGPVMVVYPEGDWYRYESEADIDAILSALKTGNRVQRLRLLPEQKRLP